MRCLVAFLFGAAAMGLQMVWLRRFTVGMGHEWPAILAVTGAVFAGHAVGAWLSGRMVPRSAVVQLWFRRGACLLAAAWALAAIPLIPAFQAAWIRYAGTDPASAGGALTALVFVALLLLPVTVPCGAILPWLAEGEGVKPDQDSGRVVSWLYASSTFGSLTALLGVGIFLVPALGLKSATACLAAILGVAGWIGDRTIGIKVARQYGTGSDGSQDQRLRGANAGDAAGADWKPWVGLAFASGLVGVGFHVVVVRLLSQILAGTVWTYIVTMAVYLVGTTSGAAAAGWAARPRRPAVLWALLAMTILGEAWILRWLGTETLAGRAGASGRVMPWDGWSGPEGELALSALVLGLPAVLMGWALALLFDLVRETGALGRAFASNAIGCMVAPAVVGMGFIPAWGSRGTWIAIVIGYALMAVVRSPARVRLAAAMPVILSFFLPGDLHLQSTPAETRIVALREGAGDTVVVLESTGGQRTLRSNNRYTMGGTASAAAEKRHSQIPLLLHPKPGRALFLGVGTGISFSAMAEAPGLLAEGVELDPKVAGLMPFFYPRNAGAESMKLHIADARRFVRAGGGRYDVVVADLFHPARDGAGFLYTQEQFRAVRDRLAEGGLFCQWLPLYQVDVEMFRMIVRTFLSVFPESDGWLLRLNADVPVLGLMGWNGRPAWHPDWVRGRVEGTPWREPMRMAGFADDFALFGLALGDQRWLSGLAGAGLLNTDDRPSLMFMAAAWDARRSARPKPHDLLVWLLDRTGDGAAGGTRMPLGGDSRRWTDYFRARDTYLKGLVAEVDGRLAVAEGAFVESALQSADFTLGYSQILTRASAMGRSNPAGAKRLLEALVKARPERPHARELLVRMGLQ